VGFADDIGDRGDQAFEAGMRTGGGPSDETGGLDSSKLQRDPDVGDDRWDENSTAGGFCGFDLNPFGSHGSRRPENYDTFGGVEGSLDDSVKILSGRNGTVPPNRPSPSL
jgi:hypothetical protein